MKANLARKPQGNDRAQVKAISEGECDIAVINSYYMGSMASDEEQSSWAGSAGIVFPNQDSTGTHINISGVALTRSAPNKENAIKLMEYLTQELAQAMYAKQNHEYPVNTALPASVLVRRRGEFNIDTLPLGQVAEARASASKMVDVVGYDN